MTTTNKNELRERIEPAQDYLFIFLGGHNYWEGLFDSVNIAFIHNLVHAGMLNHSDILMTTIISKGKSDYQPDLLREKEENLRDLLIEKGIRIQFYHIQGRTFKGMTRAAKAIAELAQPYQKRYIWAQNYYNCQIGQQVKRSLNNTHLHFDMRGLVPQEELYYSTSNFFLRVAKYLVLQFLESTNLNHADSLSVVSHRFLNFIDKKHHLDSKPSVVFPNFFDEDKFFINPSSRKFYRDKYDIADHQKLVIYSGMLQKWQDPELLFAFIKHIQDQDPAEIYRFLILTYDQERAKQYKLEYEIENLIIDNADGEALNGMYNAGDIGLAFRDENIASTVSCPVKIPEYLATGNSLILLESIGDFGRDLADKNYVMLKKHKQEFLNVSIAELNRLQRPNPEEQEEIFEKYSMKKNIQILRGVLH